ncbi:hypothetical protein ACFU99_23690 [Streptomyces sp. NPDC057654]|uniref:hypothetical protein n=1 Tax=Streptomyces sp. NPDC057654 TaxID=3346196 RepID=UPI0036ADB32A
MSPTILIVGLDPAMVDDSPSSRLAFPDVDAEKVRSGVAAARARLEELGFTVDVCALDYGRTGDAAYRVALAAKSYDLVMIGAGLRLDPVLTPLLEVVVNTTHELAPGAKICFNVNPMTTIEAVQRWWPEHKYSM